MSLDRGQSHNMVAFFADQDVGFEAVKFVLGKYPQHVKCIVTTKDNEIAEFARISDCRTLLYDEISKQNTNSILSGLEFIFLAWWPKIIPDYIIDAPTVGVVNFHPSFLPHNRGKNYNFWTLVENTPFGVTLHFVDRGIDSGDIIFQSRMSKNWEDTGETLYYKAKEKMLSLFKASYLDIVSGRFQRTPQNLDQGQLHYSNELDLASHVHLDQMYSARHLFNLLRARTFKDKPSCYFIDNDKKYEVRISITELSDEPN